MVCIQNRGPILFTAMAVTVEVALFRLLIFVIHNNNNIVFMYTVSIFSRHSVLKVLIYFFLSIISCRYSVEKLLSSRLLSKNLKIKIHKTIILSVVLCGCET